MSPARHAHGPGSNHVGVGGEERAIGTKFEANHGLLVAADERRGVTWKIDRATGKRHAQRAPPVGTWKCRSAHDAIHGEARFMKTTCMASQSADDYRGLAP